MKSSFAYFTATAVATALLITGLSPASAVDPVAPVIPQFIPGGNGIVSGYVDETIPVTGVFTSITVTGLPKGLTLNGKTGNVKGRPTAPGSYSIVFTAFNGRLKSLPMTVNWTVERLPAGTVGTYHALLDRQEWLNGGFGGVLKLTVNSNGTYSGSISRGFHRNSFTGVLDTQTGGIAPIGFFLVPRRAPYSALECSFYLPIGNGQFFGTLREAPIAPATVGVSANLFGFRAGFSKTSPPSAAFIGRWNNGYEIPTLLVRNQTYPQGAAWATQTVSNTGAVLWTGRLADGTKFTYATDLALGGQTPLHLMLFNFNSSLQGWQTLSSGTQLSSASLTWVKLITGGRSYGEGFPLHTLLGNGAKYTPPTPGSLILDMRSGANNAIATFSQGGLSTPFYQVFTVGAGNALALPLGDANPYRLNASLNVTTGLLTGSGTAINFSSTNASSARPGTFSGLVVPGRDQAVGHFLLPSDTSSSSPILSGKFIAEETSELN
jgi:Putative Ig domain